MSGTCLRVSGLVDESIVDGYGFRYTVFVQGCPHHCPGCHNPQTHPFTGGKEMTIEEIFSAFCENPLLRGMTFSGGEPFCQPKPLAELAKLVHTKNKDVTVYTGYTLEQLRAMQNTEVDALLAETDLLIDGPYLQEERDLSLQFRGSRNQRVIDMNKTRETGILTLDPAQ